MPTSTYRLFSKAIALAAFILAITATGLGSLASAASAVPYDWSHATERSKRFEVKVNGQPVFVGNFWQEHFAHFAFSERAEVEVTFLPGAIDPAHTVVSPKRLGIHQTIEGNRLRFTLTEARPYVVRINLPREPAVGLDYLILFAEGPERPPVSSPQAPVIDVAQQGIDSTGRTDVTSALAQLIDRAPKDSVLLFPRGTYAIEDLVIRRPGTSLYFAPGAFLHSRLPGTKTNRRRAVSVLDAPNVTLRGRGLIQAHGYALTVAKSPGFVLEDLTIRSNAIGKNGVTPNGAEDGGRGLLLSLSNGYRLTNFKGITAVDQEAGGGKDALNLNSSSDGLVERCFTISGDDTYTIKGGHDSNEWLEVDLGSVQPIDRVAVRWGEAYVKRYRIDTSSDQRNWETAAKVENAKAGEQLHAVRAQARYVRLFALEKPTAFHAGDLVREFEVYAADNHVNHALRRPVRVSPYGTPRPGHGPEKAVDGDPQSSWANDYRTRRVLFRNNTCLVTASPIKIGTGSDYAGEDITWENHDVIDGGFSNEEGILGGGGIGFSHYNYPRIPEEMVMRRITVRNVYFEETIGLVGVGWYFHRTNQLFPFATDLDVRFENVVFDHVYPGTSLFQIIAAPTARIRLHFRDLKVAGRLIRGLDDLRALGIPVKFDGVTDDDEIRFEVGSGVQDAR